MTKTINKIQLEMWHVLFLLNFKKLQALFSKIFDSQYIKLNVFSKILLILIITLFPLNLFSQISFGGKPYFSSSENYDISSFAKILNYKAEKKELKSVSEKLNSKAPLTFAHQFTVDYTPENSGKWYQTEQGDKIWRLSIHSPGAYSLNVIFDRYVLPPKAKLFIYNKDQSEILGAFTDKNNKPNGTLATGIISGDYIIVEYQEPKNPEFKAEIMIGAVNHDFIGVNKRINTLKSGGYGDSQLCNIDVTCYNEDKPLKVRNSVVKILVNGTELCSGTLVNNTNNDKTPYVITAAHCFRDINSPDGLYKGTNMLFYFNYQIPHCAKNIIIPNNNQSISNADLCVLNVNSDIALVKLSSMPLATFRPYYAGWSLEDNPQGLFKCIHHPSADVKKIGTSTKVMASSYVVPGNRPFAQKPNAHWKIETWETGTTEGGSSGGGLFDVNNKLIGTLSGGLASCSDPHNDYFTKIYRTWKNEVSDDLMLSPWLDPSNTGSITCNGLNPYNDRAYHKLSNIKWGYYPTKMAIENTYYPTGNNDLGYTIYLEKYSYIKSATLSAIYITNGKSSQGNYKDIDILIYEGDEYPETLIYKKKVNTSQLQVNNEKLLRLTNDAGEDITINVNGSFFVGYGTNNNSTSSGIFAPFYSRAKENFKNTLYVYDSNSKKWNKASDIYPKGFKYSMWADVLAKDVVYDTTSVIPKLNYDIKIFPVPCKTKLNVLLNNNIKAINYSIINTAGMILKKYVISKNTKDIYIDTSGLKSGLYILQINTDEKSINKKFIVE